MSNLSIAITDLQDRDRTITTVFDEPNQGDTYTITRFTPADMLFVGISKKDPSKRVIVSLKHDKHRTFKAHKYIQLALITSETEEQRFARFWGAMMMFHPITYVKVPDDADMKFMTMLAKMLMNPKCPIATLDMCYYRFDDENIIYLLFDAIAKNRSLKKLNLGYCHGDFDPDDDVKSGLTTKLAFAIKSHPCIRCLKIDGFWYNCDSIVASIPKSLRQLEIHCEARLSTDVLRWVVNTNQLRKFQFMLPTKTEDAMQQMDILLSSKSLTDVHAIGLGFDSDLQKQMRRVTKKEFQRRVRIDEDIWYKWYIFGTLSNGTGGRDGLRVVTNFNVLDIESTPPYAEIVRSIETEHVRLNTMLARNRAARSAAINAAIALIAIRQFRANECGIFGKIAKDVVLIIAKLIASLACDDAWRQSDDQLEPKRKRAKPESDDILIELPRLRFDLELKSLEK